MTSEATEAKLQARMRIAVWESGSARRAKLEPKINAEPISIIAKTVLFFAGCPNF